MPTKPTIKQLAEQLRGERDRNETCELWDEIIRSRNGGDNNGSDNGEGGGKGNDGKGKVKKIPNQIHGKHFGKLVDRLLKLRYGGKPPWSNLSLVAIIACSQHFNLTTLERATNYPDVLEEKIADLNTLPFPSNFIERSGKILDYLRRNGKIDWFARVFKDLAHESAKIGHVSQSSSAAHPSTHPSPSENTTPPPGDTPPPTSTQNDPAPLPPPKRQEPHCGAQGGQPPKRHKRSGLSHAASSPSTADQPPPPSGPSSPPTQSAAPSPLPTSTTTLAPVDRPPHTLNPQGQPVASPAPSLAARPRDTANSIPFTAIRLDDSHPSPGSTLFADTQAPTPETCPSVGETGAFAAPGSTSLHAGQPCEPFNSSIQFAAPPPGACSTEPLSQGSFPAPSSAPSLSIQHTVPPAESSSTGPPLEPTLQYSGAFNTGPEAHPTPAASSHPISSSQAYTADTAWPLEATFSLPNNQRIELLESTPQMTIERQNATNIGPYDTAQPQNFHPARNPAGVDLYEGYVRSAAAKFFSQKLLGSLDSNLGWKGPPERGPSIWGYAYWFRLREQLHQAFQFVLCLAKPDSSISEADFMGALLKGMEGWRREVGLAPLARHPTDPRYLIVDILGEWNAPVALFCPDT